MSYFNLNVTYFNFKLTQEEKGCITQHLLDRSRRSLRHSIQHMRFHHPLGGWWPPWATSVTVRGSLNVWSPLNSKSYRGHLRSPASKQPMKSHTLNRMVYRASRSGQWILSYRMAAGLAVYFFIQSECLIGRIWRNRALTKHSLLFWPE